MNVITKNDAPVSALSLELDLLRTFTAIADTGSFKAAADLVFRTPSAISMQVKRLEEIVGCPVFSRDARAVTLTPEGEVLLGYARRLLRLADEALGHFRKPSVEGIVRIGAPDEYGERFLPQILKRFGRTHPGVIVDVVIDFSANLRERARKGELDLTIVSCSEKVAREENIEIILEEPLVWTGVKGGTAHLLEPLPVSMWEEGCAWRTSAMESLSVAGKAYRVAFMSAHTAGQKAAVLADLAIAPLPKSLVEPPLVHLGEEYGLPPLRNYLIGLIVGSKGGAAAAAVAEHIKAMSHDQKAYLP